MKDRVIACKAYASFKALIKPKVVFFKDFNWLRYSVVKLIIHENIVVA